MDQKKIGKFIQEKRKEKEYSQQQLAERLGVSNRTISKWENGNSMPDYSIINDLCKELDISINELLSGEKLTEENYQKKLEENIVSTIDYNNKKRNKRIIIFIVIIIVLIFIYFLYKAFIIWYYDNRFVQDTWENNFPFNQNIHEVNIHRNNNANHIFNENINFYLPEGFELVTDKAKSGLIMDYCDVYLKNQTGKEEYDASLIICNERGDNLMNLDHYEIRDTLFPPFATSHILKKYNIKNTMDLVYYYGDHYKDKYNVLSDSDMIKMRYIAKTYSQLAIPIYDNFYFLKGDLNGRLTEFERERFREQKNKGVFNAVIYKKIDQYNEQSISFSFSNYKDDCFNHENVIEILESIY